MTPENYQALTQTLQQTLDAHEDVLGFIALGSMAETDHQPDEWSDHDFFVITQINHQQAYRDSTDWLPYPEKLVLHFQETDHGCKAIYDDGHILEYAIFDKDELTVARINSYHILIDKANIAEIMPTLQHPVTQENNAQRVFDSMISNILVGAMRTARGEILSGSAFIKQFALRAFLVLCWQLLADDSHYQDSLDPYRRFEFQFPELAQQLNSALLQPNIDAGLALLDLCQSHLALHLSENRQEAIEAIRQYLKKQV